jgi:hypothetical protein
MRGWTGTMNVRRCAPVVSTTVTYLAVVGYAEGRELSDHAKQMGVRYETTWRWYRDDTIQGRRIGLRTSIITEGLEAPGSPAKQHRRSMLASHPLRTGAIWRARRNSWRPMAWCGAIRRPRWPQRWDRASMRAARSSWRSLRIVLSESDTPRLKPGACAKQSEHACI